MEAGDEGGKQHQPLPPPSPLSVSEIKRRGRNLAEGCKYYKVTLRRMRELKGSPREGEGGDGPPEDNAKEQASERMARPLLNGRRLPSDVNYVQEG